jgi:hypothetical protein
MHQQLPQCSQLSVNALSTHHPYNSSEARRHAHNGTPIAKNPYTNLT